MQTVRDFAIKYLEDVLSFFGLNVEIKAEEEDNVINLDVPSTHLNGFLIGQKGENLRALQHLTNMALKRNEYEDAIVTIDVAGYKRQRNQRLIRRVEQIAQKVIETGEEQSLHPMSAYDRRVVHKALGEMGGVTTESTGEGRDRKVVIKKAADAGEAPAEAEE